MAIRIFIDQGHNPSGVNAGAEGNGLREQDVTYNVGIYLANLLNDDPRFTARVSRPTPETVLGTSNATSLQARVNMANSWPADYFISIHANASENPDINGTEAYVSSTDSAAWYLAQNIVTEIVRRTSTKYNVVFSRPSLYVLKNTKMPAVLVELGYITNYEDNQRMINEPYQFAYGIYVGLLNYLGLKQ